VGFFDANKRIANKIETWYLQGLNMEALFKQAVQTLVRPDSLILDAGAGQRSFYSRSGLRIIGADLLSHDLVENPDIESAVVANLSKDFPFRPETFDGITACYFIEHLPDSGEFIRNAAKTLKPGGKLFLLFPCRYAPFAVINRLIPNKWTVRLLSHFLKSSHGGFPATYSNCSPNKMRRVLERNGFRIVLTKVCHYQAFYYSAFLPLYLLNLAYDGIMRAFKLEFLASSGLIVAEKTGQVFPERINGAG
jgi:2-polyprenyl-3-methyl-5-hydroxy-6-metoxy-1,4-benzoquinol methylase